MATMDAMIVEDEGGGGCYGLGEMGAQPKMGLYVEIMERRICILLARF